MRGVCADHYYCSCETDNIRRCHYCRKRNTFYKEHYICLGCCVGWKSKYDSILESYVDGAQFHKINQNPEFKGARCSRCGSDGIEVGRDFRVPKKNDTKSWTKLKKERATFPTNFSFSYYMQKKYRYNCGGGGYRSKPNLYKTREKRPRSRDAE